MMDKETGRHRGFGFVNYERREDVDKVLQSGPHYMDGQMVRFELVFLALYVWCDLRLIRLSSSSRSSARRPRANLVAPIMAGTTTADPRTRLNRWAAWVWAAWVLWAWEGWARWAAALPRQALRSTRRPCPSSSPRWDGCVPSLDTRSPFFLMKADAGPISDECREAGTLK